MISPKCPTKNLKLSPQDRARLELEIRRRGLRKSLSFEDWLNKTQPLFQWDVPHLVYIRKHLQKIVDGELRKLMIFTPPRHGKSQQNTISFPAWYLERWPENRVIIGAYNQTLAEKFSRKARKLTRAKLAQDRTAVSDWETVKGGGLRAVGVGGGITGMGGNLILIDDPVKSREEAESEVYREKCWDWYTDDLYTRLEPGGAIVLTMTRWHDDDLAGRILASEDGHNWTVIELPAFAEDNDILGRQLGEALWPERYNATELAGIRTVMGIQSFTALYQQKPTADEGDYFKREWFETYKQTPRRLSVYMCSDYAVTGDGGNYTEHGVFGVDANDDIYIIDWWYGQTPSDEWIESGLDLVRTHKPLMWVGESGVIKKAVEPFLLRRMRERQDYVRLEWLPSITDKPARARAFQARCSNHKILFPVNEPWSERLQQQLLRFPNGKHDDAVDVCSLMGRALEMVFAPEHDESEEAFDNHQGRSAVGGY